MSRRRGQVLTDDPTVSVPDEDDKSARASTTLGWRTGLLLIALITVVHSISPAVQIGDSRLSVPVAASVLRNGSLDLRGDPRVVKLANHYDVVRRNGRLLPFFPWPPMLLALPETAVLDLAGRDPANLKPSDPNQTWIVEIPTASALIAVTAWLLALIAFDAVGGPTRRRRRFAIGIALLFAFSTGAWSSGSRALGQHTPSMLLLALAILLALRIRRRPGNAILFGAALAAAYIVRPTNAVALVVMFVWLAATNRGAVLRALGGAASVGAIFVAVNVASYGSLLPPYYAAGRLGSETTIGFGETLLMNLVSPSRGLLIYDPILVLAISGIVVKLRRKTMTGLDAAVATVVVGQWIVIGRYGSTGGSSYGPRLMSDIIPYLIILSIPALAAVFLRDRTRTRHRTTVAFLCLTLLFITWGVAVNASGALFRSAYCWSADPVHVDSKPSRVWDWSDPQFFRPVRDVARGSSLRTVAIGSCRSRHT